MLSDCFSPPIAHNWKTENCVYLLHTHTHTAHACILAYSIAHETVITVPHTTLCIHGRISSTNNMSKHQPQQGADASAPDEEAVSVYSISSDSDLDSDSDSNSDSDADSESDWLESYLELDDDVLAAVDGGSGDADGGSGSSGAATLANCINRSLDQFESAPMLPVVPTVLSSIMTDALNATNGSQATAESVDSLRQSEYNLSALFIYEISHSNLTSNYVRVLCVCVCVRYVPQSSCATSRRLSSSARRRRAPLPRSASSSPTFVANSRR